MKQLSFFLFAAVCLAACNNEDKTSKEETTAADAKVAGTNDEQKMDYAYIIEKPDQWQWGSKENTKMVLASLKAYETNNIDECIKAFGDSVELHFEGLEGKFSKDSVKAMFAKSRGAIKTSQIKMNDFESVKSKDGKEEWVSLWYKEKWEDQKGVWDSATVMDDVRIKDGKIVEIDQKTRKYPKTNK